MPQGTKWSELATATHTCGIRNDGQLFCWGSNFYGQLGIGTTEDMLTLTTAVTGTWSHVAVENSYTCAIRADHSLWCWGADQPDVKHLVPTRVDLATDWDSLAVSGNKNCAVKVTGTLWCWGTMPDGSAANTPTQIGAATDWKSIALGVARCGVKTGGTLWCWDSADALGDGSPIRYDLNGNYITAQTPTQIGTDTDWEAVTTGGPQCGLKTDGTVLCWGRRAKQVPLFATTPVVLN